MDKKVLKEIYDKLEDQWEYWNMRGINTKDKEELEWVNYIQECLIQPLHDLEDNL